MRIYTARDEVCSLVTGREDGKTGGGGFSKHLLVLAAHQGADAGLPLALLVQCHPPKLGGVLVVACNHIDFVSTVPPTPPFLRCIVNIRA